MKKTTKILTTLALASIGVSAFANDNTQPQIKADGDASYVIGYQIGSGMAKQGIDMNDAQTLQGFKDAIQGENPRLSDWQINKNMERLKDQIMDKQMDLAKQNAKDSEEFMNQVAKMSNVIKVDDGVYYQMLKQGEGNSPDADATVTIAYQGTTPVVAYEDNKTLLNDVKEGKMIGPTFDKNDNATFPLQNLISCWKKGIPAIPAGSTFILYCSPDEAYGKNAPPSIGPNQALAFKITLKDYKTK